MNRLSIEDQVSVVSALVEGNSIRSTVRMTGIAKKTVLRLLVDVGRACWAYQDKHLVDLACRRVQCDEIWSFCYAKENNVPEELKGKYGVGDVWTWVAMDADSKLVINWNIGERNADMGDDFMKNLEKRLKNRVQLTTDGYKVYLDAVENAFGSKIDYAQLLKIYGRSDATAPGNHRYSPTECIGIKHKKLIGRPLKRDISTSFIERQNLTMRMGMRRFTRLTNAFSKKIDNHWWAVSLHFMNYNFCRIHQTIRSTPAIRAGVTDRVWDIKDIVMLMPWNRQNEAKAQPELISK